jgi:hypothetical protein
MSQKSRLNTLKKITYGRDYGIGVRTPQYMEGPASTFAVPLLQASLVMLALFLGSTRYLVRRERDSSIGEAGIVTAASIVVIFSAFYSLFPILNATSNEYINRAVISLMILTIATVGTAVAVMITDVSETGHSLRIKHAFWTFVSLLLFLAITWFVMWFIR